MQTKKKSTKKLVNKSTDKRVKLTDRLLTEFKQIYRDTGGNMSLACASIGIQRDTMYKHLENNPSFKTEIARLKEARSIKAEQNITEAIEAKDIKVTQWLKEKTDIAYQPTLNVHNVNLNIDAKDIENLEGDELLNIISNS